MAEQWVSSGTAATILVGLVVGFFYLRYMWGALQRAVRTRDEADHGQDQYRFSLVGAIVAVLGSIAAITVYGLRPGLLYVGPVLAVASAVAVSYCLREEYVEEEPGRRPD
jgi:hypothetical protein